MASNCQKSLMYVSLCSYWSVLEELSLAWQLPALDQGPYSWKILVLKVAPSNKSLRKFLEMWVFPLRIKEK